MDAATFRGDLDGDGGEREDESVTREVGKRQVKKTGGGDGRAVLEERFHAVQKSRGHGDQKHQQADGEGQGADPFATQHPAAATDKAQHERGHHQRQILVFGQKRPLMTGEGVAAERNQCAERVADGREAVRRGDSRQLLPFFPDEIRTDEGNEQDVGVEVAFGGELREIPERQAEGQHQDGGQA